MSTSGRINPDFPAMEGPDELTEDDYADFWIPEFDEEFGDEGRTRSAPSVHGEKHLRHWITPRILPVRRTED
jgi:hypothetical protein